MEWYQRNIRDVFEALQTNENGLRSDIAADRLKQFGPNALPKEKVKSFTAIFFAQFASPFVYVLFAAAAIVMLIGDPIDSIVIFAALLINAIVGAVQEGRAREKLSALKRFTESKAVLVRGGVEIIVPDRILVPGDVIVLREGDKVPADARVFFALSFKVDEAAITGESEPVLKTTEPLAGQSIGLGDQTNMAFKGTLVVSGHARAVVVATGAKTFVGVIALKLSAIDTSMPLKKDISYLTRAIIIGIFIVVTVLFLLGLLKGFSVREMFSTAVAIAVSAIPEGLPVVVTLVLATGVARMSARNALVKRLQAVEALGQAKIIAVDKTGTVTRNQMMVGKLYTGGKYFEVSGNGYEPHGEIIFDGQTVEPLDHPELLLLGRTGMLTATARTLYSPEKKIWERISGDPTEVAIFVLAEKMGFHKDDLERENPKILEIPFEARLKYHAAINVHQGTPIFSITGAPDALLPYIKEVWRDGKPRTIDIKGRQILTEVQKAYSSEGLRVLLIAANFQGLNFVKADALPPLCFLGFVGIADAIRPEVMQAVADTKAAGMKVVMITGDHADTGEAIARKIGIFNEGDRVLLGEEIERLTIKELSAQLARVTVFARVSPEHKLKIIEAYRARGEIIAMTGDGVNDALSLAAADLGVAMGTIGTEVAKEAADIVLLDDNFGSIAAAVEEGRNIYLTIRKVLLYLFSTSIGEILAITLGIVLGYPLLLTPSQIIWLNLVTDGFLVVALAMEPKGRYLLRPNFKLSKGFLGDLVGLERIMLMSAVMTLGTLILFDSYLSIDPVKAGTIALTALAVFQWFNAWNCRSERVSFFSMSLTSNKFLPWATGAVVALQLAALHVPFFQKILHTTPLNLNDWIIIVAAGFFIIVADEVRKIVYRARFRNNSTGRTAVSS